MIKIIAIIWIFPIITFFIGIYAGRNLNENCRRNNSFDDNNITRRNRHWGERL